MSFLGEIKRRKVFQVAAVYAVVAWLAVQVITSIETPLGLPDWVDTLVIVLLTIGFPITLIISWAFNVTPDGLVRDQAGRTLAQNESRRIEYVLIGLLVAAVGWLFYRDIDTVSDTSVVAAVPTSELVDQETDSEVLPNSIAVLLCDNFSTDQENDFFAASLHEEMLNQLVKLRNLNVIARTSVLQYADVAMPITEIAEELRVESVMECSVAYGDGRIVISAQLIDGESGLHIWSDRYNRQFEDVFGIQADIAMNVANALAVEFSLEEQQAIERAPTDSREAYALYLQAMSIAGVDNTETLTLLERALDFDREFASVHRLKAVIHEAALINTTGSDAASTGEREQHIELAHFHAARAAEIDPSLAWFAGRVGNFSTWHWSDALVALDDAPDPLDQLSTWLYSFVGEHEKAIARARRGVDLDPRNPTAVWTLGVALAYAGETDEAARLHHDAIALAPTAPIFRSWLAFIEIARGNAEAAAAELARAEQLLAQNRQAVFLPELAYSYARLGRRVEADRIVAEIEKTSEDIEIGAGGWAMVYLSIGDRVQAVEQLEAAIAKIENYQIDEGLFNLMNVRMNISADPVLEEPQFVELRNRLRGN